jgi:hypothetical protein
VATSVDPAGQAAEVATTVQKFPVENRTENRTTIPEPDQALGLSFFNPRNYVAAVNTQKRKFAENGRFTTTETTNCTYNAHSLYKQYAMLDVQQVCC